jgi:hypothetical protein
MIKHKYFELTKEEQAERILFLIGKACLSCSPKTSRSQQNQVENVKEKGGSTMTNIDGFS